MDNVIVGIDLGTTNSLCAVFDGEPKLIPNANGDVLTPSVVGLTEDGKMLVGSAARELRVTNPELCASTFKRFMGMDREIQVGKKAFGAIELSSLVLKSLREDAEAYLGSRVTEAVITVPAYFNDQQRKATKVAGELAGLTVRRIINEPTAAALTYGFHERHSDKKLIVIDLGGGTFDVTLMEIFEGTLEIVATAGESFLGGEDFTDRLMAKVLASIGLQLETAELRQPLMVARLRDQCERAKRTLGSEDTAAILIPNELGFLSEDARRVSVSRRDFAKISKKLIERLKKPVARVMRDAECGPEDIEDVILVGGATRMSVLREFVADFLQKEPICEQNPDEVVALGASVQAALISDDAAVEDMVMTDVCPFTLGVETTRQYGSRFVDGLYTPIIHRNTTIPVSREEVFHTLTPNQRSVTIRVYQGEGRKVADNVKLGELVVDDIPPGPADQEIYIRFTYDLNGILEVEAMAADSGRKHQAILTNHVSGLSQAEIHSAVKKLQDLKFYPREQLDGQRLLRFCNRAIGEVSPLHREQLEMAIAGFEAAMQGTDREEYEHSHKSLLMTLSALGLDYRDSEDDA